MWNDAIALNRVAGFLYAVAVLLIAYAMVARVAQSDVFALKEIRLVGDVAHVTREQVRAVASRELRGNFFTVNLRAARNALEKLPWIRSVDVRRRWPDRLEVDVQEHRALARWGDEALVDTYGTVFEGASNEKLPVMIGPTGSSQEVTTQFVSLQKTLAPLGRSIEEIRLSERRAWMLRLDDDTVIELGRENAQQRLAMFVSVYERSLAKLKDAAGYVDLRYANGFAVRVNGLKWSDRRA